MTKLISTNLNAAVKIILIALLKGFLLFSQSTKYIFRFVVKYFYTNKDCVSYAFSVIDGYKRCFIKFWENNILIILAVKYWNQNTPSIMHGVLEPKWSSRHNLNCDQISSLELCQPNLSFREWVKVHISYKRSWKWIIR